MKNLLPLLLLFLFTACDKAETADNEAEVVTELEHLEQSDDKDMVLTEPDFAEPLASYMVLKNELVASDAAGAKQAATQLAEVAEGELQEAARAVATAYNLPAMRKAFEPLSMLVYQQVKTNGSSQVLYKQYCPMAFDNKGAYWLSGNKEIRNPYFGDMMLKCGEVQETLAKN
jgi:hypothetical protein